MTEKKKSKGGLFAVFHFDKEDGELTEFMWNEDHDPPPLVKARRGRKSNDQPSEESEYKN